MQLSKILIDSSTSHELNESYYKSNVGLSFITEAMRPEYQSAFARYLYGHISENFPFMERINVLEMGARGVYFEKGVYAEMTQLDSENGTRVADKIRYTLFDLSAPAMENAKEEADGTPLFETSFAVGNAVTGELPRETSVFIMNELLDDLDHAVIARINGQAYRIDYKLVYSYDYVFEDAIVGFKAVRRTIDEGDWRLAAYARNVPENRVMPVLLDADALFGNISKAAASHDGVLLFMHDYGMLSAVPLRRAHGLRRLFSSNPPSEVLRSSIDDGMAQITTDVGWPAVTDSLSRKGFCLLSMDSHDLFVDRATGARTVNTQQLARLLNMLKKHEKAELLGAMGVAGRQGKINAELVLELNRLFEGQYFKHAERGIEGKGIEINTLSLRNVRAASALYDFYAMHSWRVENAYFDVEATIADTTTADAKARSGLKASRR